MLLLLFFMSGFTALVYEVVWQRLLHVVFGLSTYAVTVTTAAFMLGLALGYLVGQHRRLCRYHPFVVYGVAEGLIAALALAFPTVLRGVEAVYVASGGSFGLQILLTLLVLACPATLMGLTLPTLARHWPRGRAAILRHAAWRVRLGRQQLQSSSTPGAPCTRSRPAPPTGPVPCRSTP